MSCVAVSQPLAGLPDQLAERTTLHVGQLKAAVLDELVAYGWG